MFRSRKKSSIGWKITVTFFLMVFIALTIVGVFLMQQLEAYHMNTIRDNLTKSVDEGALERFGTYVPLSEHKSQIQSAIDMWHSSIQEEIFVIDTSLQIVASSNSGLTDRSAVGNLDEALILKGMEGRVTESDGMIDTQKIPVKNMVFPIQNGEKVIGVLYMRADLSSLYQTMDQAKLILIQAMAVALLVTVVLGSIVSRSIIRPINEVTEKAVAMSQGDFSSQVEIKSHDEIGRLGEMFNIMGTRLAGTLLEISEEKNKFEIILRTMADGLIAADMSGKIIHVNPAAMQMLRLTQEETENQSYNKLIERFCPDLTTDRIRKKPQDQWEGSEIFEWEGSIFYARHAVFRQQLASEIGVVLIVQDITQRQKLESMQRDFVANVSHELNTPLTTIKSYTETILDSEELLGPSEITHQFLKVIDSEAERMSRIVKDLLQLSRLEYQRETWNKTRQDLVKIVENVVMKIEINAVQKNQHLNRLFPSEAQVMVFVDSDKIEQALMNLLINAIKYTEENGRIDIDIVPKRTQVQIIVMDNGIGISEKELPRLFERFYRVDKARSRSMGGTGLGLSIAKQIIEEHEGSIVIESKEGRGTTVIVTLPIDQAAGPA